MCYFVSYWSQLKNQTSVSYLQKLYISVIYNYIFLACHSHEWFLLSGANIEAINHGFIKSASNATGLYINGCYDLFLHQSGSFPIWQLCLSFLPLSWLVTRLVVTICDFTGLNMTLYEYMWLGMAIYATLCHYRWHYVTIYDLLTLSYIPTELSSLSEINSCSYWPH